MAVKEIKKDALRAHVAMTFEKEDYAERKKKFLNEARREADIKGFRRGMAPMSIIEKFYGGQSLVKAIDGLINENLQKYIESNKLSVIGEPMPVENADKKNDWDNPGKFEFEFEMALTPVFEVSVSKDDHLTDYKPAPTKEEKADYKSRILKSYGHPEELDAVEEEAYLIVTMEQGERKIEKHYISLTAVEDKNVKAQFIGKKKGDVLVVNAEKLYPEATVRAGALKVKEEELSSLDPKWSVTIDEIRIFKDATPGQELYDQVFGKDEVKDEAAFDAKLQDKMLEELMQEVDYRFMLDAKAALMKKADIKVAEDILKKWLLSANEGKVTAEQVDKEFPAFLKDFQWQMIAGKIIRDQKLKVTKEDKIEKAKLMAKYQFMNYYGTMNLPEDILQKYAEQMVADPQHSQRIQEMAEEKVVLDYVRATVTMDEKKISVKNLRNMNE